MSFPGGYPPYPPHQQGPGQYSQPQPYQGATPSYPAYPPTSGAAQPGYPSPYPPTSSPYPPTSSPYPPAPYPGAGYPPSSQGYPPTAQGYPPSSQGYPPSSQGYPPTAQGFPPSTQTPGYPTQQYHPPQGQHPPPVTASHAQPLYGGAPPQTQQSYSKGTPTVRPAHPFDAKADAEVLRRAMKGFGTDEKAIIQVVTNRTNAQRQEIALSFKAMYGKDLIANLKSELSGNFEDLVVALMTPTAEYCAKELHHAMSGVGTNERTLVELLCSATNQEIHAMRQAYERLYNSSLEQELAGETSGSFRRLLVSLVQGRRNENYIVDHHAAVVDAQALLNAGELQLGTDESTFNMVLATRSYPQLIQVFMEYQRLAGHGIEKAIRGEFSGDIETGLLAIIHCGKDKAGYFAEQLYESMSGAGTRDRALIRIVTLRSEVDLEDIKRAFHHKYGKMLSEFIREDTSDHMKKALLSLID